jgi:hypothetical protein
MDIAHGVTSVASQAAIIQAKENEEVQQKKYEKCAKVVKILQTQSLSTWQYRTMEQISHFRRWEMEGSLLVHRGEGQEEWGYPHMMASID